jgi:hypothetical protein
MPSVVGSPSSESYPLYAPWCPPRNPYPYHGSASCPDISVSTRPCTPLSPMDDTQRYLNCAANHTYQWAPEHTHTCRAQIDGGNSTSAMLTSTKPGMRKCVNLSHVKAPLGKLASGPPQHPHLGRPCRRHFDSTTNLSFVPKLLIQLCAEAHLPIATSYWNWFRLCSKYTFYLFLTVGGFLYSILTSIPGLRKKLGL